MGINIVQMGSTEDILQEPKYGAVNTPDELYIPNVTSKYLYDLNSEEYKLRIPLQVLIVQEEDNSYLVQEPLSGLWADGKILSRVEKSLKRKILHLYKKLKKFPKEELGPFPEDCLMYLENHIS